jgi:hypothetical protein
VKIASSIIFLLLFCSFSDEDKNNDVIIFEKVYLHLDRHFYLSGDDIWFKAYLINAQTNKPAAESSKILYAELISPDGRRLDRKVLYVDESGCSIGDFRLRKSALPGKYRIRAYTKWMLNFGDVFVFEKEIEVKNIPDEFEITGTKKKRKDENSKLNETVINPEDLDIEFFPESGSLVSGIENIVAFKATDWSGKGVNVSGGVLNSEGDTLALFASEYLGMGKFVFTPQAGEYYYAFFMPDSIPYPFFAQLPESLEEGFTINILDNDTAFHVNMQTNPETCEEFAGKKMQLVFRHSEVSLFSYETVLEDCSKFLNLPKSLLPSGITRIILYDEQDRPYCERLVYIENREKINMQITPVNDSTVIMRLTDSDGQAVHANLSMSVTGNTVPDEIYDMESYVWLESEVKGKIERPKVYFDTANADRLKQMDLLLLTQGWRDYVWIHAEMGISEFTGYQREQGLKISGHVKKLFGKKPYPNANIYLYFPHIGLEEGVRYTQTDSLGNYDFGHVDFWGNQDIFINSKSWKQKDAGEIFLYPLCMPEEQFPVKAWLHYQTDNTYKFPRESYTKKDYKLSDTIVLDPVKIIGKNPKGWLMSNREITPKDDSVWMALDLYIGGRAPCLKIPYCKGIHIANYNYFDMDGKRIYNRVPPSKISIKEVDKVVIYRKDAFNGLNDMKYIYTIDVYAKNGKFSTMRYPTKIFVKSTNGGIYLETVDGTNYNSMSPIVSGYYETRKFYKSRFVETADINSYYGTYLWEPDIRTNVNGETVLNYNPEKKFPGKIRIEGITNKGIPFTVKLK